MAKQKRARQPAKKAETDSRPTLADGLGDDTLQKLMQAKKDLVSTEQAEEARKKEQAAKARRDREKNMSFAELLDKYGDGGTKY
ncbi:YqkE family protein [Bhargavaea cecembensis]|uniref:YqkE family protein n=1 Tax=Bhargavaea cecembensis TaxID=394098 RepID=UPI00058CDB1E|nr:YqkE family protein [Bhargavaea cecembensis]